MNRAAAVRIVAMRRLIIRGLIERMLDRPADAELSEARFNALARALPLYVHLDGALAKRVEMPARRLLERKGLLALRSWAGVR